MPRPDRATGTPVLRAADLVAGYSGVAVVRGVSIDVHPGELVVMLGPNGAGKTTTVLTLAGALQPLGGTVEMDGAAGSSRLHRRVRSGLGLVPEDRSLVSGLTTLDSLRLARGPLSRAFELFPELEQLGGRQAGLLSGGEQRMLAVARALMPDPRVVLADELSLGLAPKVVTRLLGSLREAADGGAGVLLVEQHAREALAVADRAFVLARGAIAWAGTGAEARERLSEITSTYLGAASLADDGRVDGGGTMVTRSDEFAAKGDER